jgi:hypothetical protein
VPFSKRKAPGNCVTELTLESTNNTLRATADPVPTAPKGHICR